MKNKKSLLVILIAVVLLVFMLVSCTENAQREIKSIQSNWTGGLNRKVEVYDYNGELIKSWEGKFDVKASERNYVYFDDADGKRVIISGGIIINEEIK